MIQTLQAVVLRSEDLAEADKRLTLYTREYGKIRAKAVGVKKSVSKLRALTLPFLESRLQIFLAGTPRAGAREPGKLISGEILAHHAPLRSDWECMLQATALCEILDHLTHFFYPSPREYDLLSGALTLMEASPSPLLVRLRSTLMLLKILGYSLRHHSTWSRYSSQDKALLKNLAVWDGLSDLFSPEETARIEAMANQYLANYLHQPLKTALFQQKLARAAEQNTAAEFLESPAEPVSLS